MNHRSRIYNMQHVISIAQQPLLHGALRDFTASNDVCRRDVRDVRWIVLQYADMMTLHALYYYLGKAETAHAYNWFYTVLTQYPIEYCLRANMRVDWRIYPVGRVRRCTCSHNNPGLLPVVAHVHSDPLVRIVCQEPLLDRFVRALVALNISSREFDIIVAAYHAPGRAIRILREQMDFRIRDCNDRIRIRIMRAEFARNYPATATARTDRASAIILRKMIASRLGNFYPTCLYGIIMAPAAYLRNSLRRGHMETAQLISREGKISQQSRRCAFMEHAGSARGDEIATFIFPAGVSSTFVRRLIRHANITAMFHLAHGGHIAASLVREQLDLHIERLHTFAQYRVKKKNFIPIPAVVHAAPTVRIIQIRAERQRLATVMLRRASLHMIHLDKRMPVVDINCWITWVHRPVVARSAWGTRSVEQ